VLQVQLKPPVVLAQAALALQLSVFAAHSSTSTHAVSPVPE
jgi:hypothetical protein